MAKPIVPIEVFQAATGDPAPLAALLRCQKELDKKTRLAIAMFVEGKLDSHKKKGRGRPKLFSNWDEWARSPHERAARYVEFPELSHDEEDPEVERNKKGMSHKEAVKRALAENHKHGCMNATEDQITDYLRKSESQRPKPPELSSLEDCILHEFDEYQRKNPSS